MKANLETEDAKAQDILRKQTVESVISVVKSAMGFRNFLLRGLAKVKTAWTLLSLAFNRRCMVAFRVA
jgi:hypothetical protein